MMHNSRFKKIIIRIIIAMVILILIGVGILVIRDEFKVTVVDVTGNEHYTVREIEDIVMDGRYGSNSIYLFFKYRNKSVNDIPFIEKMEVKIESPHHIRINVYEKAIAGYIEYLGHYIYFDREGIAVESSNEVIEGIPFVTGLEFDHIVLHEPLPARDEKIFARILSITQLLTKNSIPTDKIYFDANEEITLYFGDVRVFIGTDDYIDEKINELYLLMPDLQGYSGVLHMEKYKGEGGNFTLELDEEELITVEEDDGEEAPDEDGDDTGDDAQNQSGDNGHG